MCFKYKGIIGYNISLAMSVSKLMSDNTHTFLEAVFSNLFSYFTTNVKVSAFKLLLLLKKQ